MAQLYAICRETDTLEVKHIQISIELEKLLDGLFQQQEIQFLSGVDNEVIFNGDWKPDDDEVLIIKSLPEAEIILQATEQNAISLPVLDVANFDTQGVRGLIWCTGTGPSKRLLLQNFGPQQLLSSRFSLLFRDDVLRRLDEPAFSLDTKIVATINTSADVRFKSYPMLRRILDITPVFREATDQELHIFCDSDHIDVTNKTHFVSNADEIIRKYVIAISKSNVLSVHTVDHILNKANSIGFQLQVNSGKIKIPQDRKEAKILFSFLLNKVYLGPLDEQLLIANSVRSLQ
ncbi:hypothetical protein [Brucella anthropi]|uniref:hypothetical protein n=1 Tax=Brucella anthropi TaxID=529 RepID=UPI00124E51CF|nr:hypothetical protein [Brucella anthropi]KAB2750395.1 hypothetical protein F9L05_07655 [Brucella anthropi]MDH0365739.1 hypothetical protein [Brucella anthropi]